MDRKADSIRRKAASRGAASRDRPTATTAKKTRRAKSTKTANTIEKATAKKPVEKAGLNAGKRRKQNVQLGPALRLFNVAIIRGERLIQQNINHEMRPGQMTLLTGPNGSGKSSLLRAISRRLTTVRGSISCTVPILYVGHQDGISGVLSGRQNLTSWAEMNYVADAESRIEDAIGQLNAIPFANLPTRVLSRGQRRRFALARLLMGPPGALWLLDEPSVGLDIETMQVLDNMISHHLGRNGLVMAATHLPLAPYAQPEVLALSDSAGEGMSVMLASRRVGEPAASESSAEEAPEK